MSGGRRSSSLEGMTGDFLPHRRQATIRTQALAILGIVAATVGVIYLLN
jgi:hypothetical protein